MWETLQRFVSSILKIYYKFDADVASDENIALWCEEMQSSNGGQMTSFPDIQTIEDLVNAVTMCIHIASPLHSSVNYLQSYYQSFVPNKPASLMRPLPNTLTQLMTYKEEDIIASLPVNDSHVWLMSSQLPYLLSYGVAPDQTLISYAKTLKVEARQRKEKGWQGVEAAAKTFCEDLLELGAMFAKNSDAMDDEIVPYTAMDPMEMAVSILI